MYFSQNLSISCSIQVPYFDKLNFLHNSVYKINGFYNRKHVNKEIALITQVRCSKCYVVKYFEGSNAVKTTSMRIQKTTPIICSYVMFESKKLKFLLLIRRKEQIEPKKVQLAAKKSFLEFRGFRTFFAVGHPLCDVVLFLVDLFLPSDVQQKRGVVAH